ncbi:neuropeptide F receptor-like protein, partial [Dinothrombium tinctorium]
LVTCKLVEGLEATSIFVSTISITAIALDRYNVIIKPKKQLWKPLQSIFILTSIWLFGLSLSLPLFWSRTIKEDNLREKLKGNVPKLVSALDIPNVTVELCIEEWPLQHGRAIYSLFTVIFQYILPIIIVSISYTCICNRLENRMLEKTKGTQLEEKREQDRNRVHRTNLLLRYTAIIFGISWLPLNILNILTDLWITFDNPSTFRIVFACCHMIGMSSACSNPFLYGWLNDNFRKEFKEILAPCCPSRAQTELIVLCQQDEQINSQLRSQRRNESINKKCDLIVVSNNV